MNALKVLSDTNNNEYNKLQNKVTLLSFKMQKAKE